MFGRRQPHRRDRPVDALDMFWDPGAIALLFFFAVLLVAPVACMAVFVVPCLWREGGCLDRRRAQRTSH